MAKLQAVRIERIAVDDQEIKLPWRCFACQDSGLVGGRFLSEFVEGESDIPFICRRDDCEFGRRHYTAWNANDDPQYQRSFDGRLDKYSCDDIHQWEKEYFVKDIVARVQRNKSVFQQFDEAVDRRNKVIAEIQEIANLLGGLQDNFSKTVAFYSDRDSTNYQDWQALPNQYLEALLIKVKEKLEASDGF